MQSRRIVNWAMRIYESSEKWLATFSALIVILMMCFTVIDVTLRYIFNSPIQGSYVVAQFMMVGIVFLGIAYVQSMKGHVKVAFLLSRASPTVREVLTIFGYVMGLFTFAVVTWRCADFAWDAWQTQDYTMGIIHYPVWPAKSLVALGCGMLCIRLLLDIVYSSARLLHQQYQTQE